MIVNTQIILKNVKSSIKLVYDVSNIKNCSLIDLFTQNEIVIKPGEVFPYNPKIHLFYQNNIHSQIIIFLYIECSTNVVNQFYLHVNESAFTKLYPIKINYSNHIDLIHHNINYNIIPTKTIYHQYNSYILSNHLLNHLSGKNDKLLPVLVDMKEINEEKIEIEENTLIIPYMQSKFVESNLKSFLLPDNDFFREFGILPEKEFFKILNVYTNQYNDDIPKVLVLPGGGVHGFALLGALNNYVNILPHIELFAGTSIGAIISTLLSIGYTPSEIFDIMSEKDISKALPDETYLSLTMNILSSYCISSGNTFVRDCISEMFELKGISKTITFKELVEKTKKYITICCSCLNTRLPVYFNAQSYPNAIVIDVLMMSSCLPFIWQPIIFEGNVYVDGGLCDNLPLNEVKNYYNITLKSKKGKRIPFLAFDFYKVKNTSETQEIMSSVYSYVRSISGILLNNLKQSANKELLEKVTILKLDTKIASSNFNLSKEEMTDMYRQGQLSIYKS